MRTRKSISEQEHPGRITCALSLKDNYIASTSTGTSDITVWEQHSGEVVRKLAGHTGLVDCLLVVPHEKLTLLATGSRDKTIRMWDVKTGNVLLGLHGHEGPIKCLALLSDGRLVSGGGSALSVGGFELKVWANTPVGSDSAADGGEPAEPAANGDAQDAA